MKCDSQSHIPAHESANRTVVDHIGAKPFFEAIGEQDNRNRRWRQPCSVKIKLMDFDYVFADRGHQYLAMETEKLEYFSGNQGIDRSYLPGASIARRTVESRPLGTSWTSSRSSSRARSARGLLWSVLLHRPGGQKALVLRHLLAAQYRDLLPAEDRTACPSIRNPATAGSCFMIAIC